MESQSEALPGRSLQKACRVLLSTLNKIRFQQSPPWNWNNSSEICELIETRLFFLLHMYTMLTLYK